MSTRHAALYAQGREASERKQRARIHVQALREQAAMDECVSHPPRNLLRTVTAPANAPRLFEKAVERMRRGAAARRSIDSLLTPRRPMQPRSANQNPAGSITVEVTKDGQQGIAIEVGKFVLHRGSDPVRIAAVFARTNKLTRQQQDRLQKELQIGMNSAFSS